MDIEKEKTMAKNEDGYEKYLGYIEDSLDEVAEKVTRIFDERKKGLAATLCGMLRDATSCATHYEWRRGDCPYDTSGELKDCGDIDLNIFHRRFFGRGIYRWHKSNLCQWTWSFI